MPIIVFILLLTVIGQTAVDIYLPSLPSMVHDLNTTATIIQLSLTTFLIGFAVSQLIYGPLSDRYGRKPILLIGLIIFLTGTLICVFSTHVDWLLIGRIIQGLGVGAASMMSRAISRAIFEGKALAKISAYVAMSWAVIPILAPLLGSYIQTYLGWRYNFGLLMLIALLLIISVTILMPETRADHVKTSQASPLITYKLLLSNKVFLKYILCVMILYGIFVDFNIAGPFLLQNIFSQSVVAYGWWVVLVASGYIIGSYLSSRLIYYLDSHRIISIGILGLLIFSVLMSILAIVKIQSLFILVIPMFFILGCSGLVYPQCISESLSPFPKIAGSAGALFGFMVFLGGSLASAIISHLSENNVIPLASMILVQVILVSVIYFGIKINNN